MSPESSLDLLLPFTAWRLLGGAPSSTAPGAGLFLSSILAKVAGRGSADGEVAIGIRKGAATTRKKRENGVWKLKVGIGKRGGGARRRVVLASATAARKMKLKGERACGEKERAVWEWEGQEKERAFRVAG